MRRTEDSSLRFHIRQSEWLLDRAIAVGAAARQVRRAHHRELSFARAAQLLRLQLDQPLKVTRERRADQMSRFSRGGMCSASGLRHDLIDQSELEQIRRRQFQRRRRCRNVLLAACAPQNRGASFGRDHGVARILLHQHDVRHAERERTARAALANHARDDWHGEPRHQLEVVRDRLGLPALLGADARLGALRVDKRDNRQAESLRQFVDARRLAIALGMRLAEVALDSFGGRAASLMPDYCDRAMAKIREARHYRAVVGEVPVTMYLDKITHQQVDVIERLRAIRMPCEAHAFDCAARIRSLRLGRRDSVAAVPAAPRLISVVIAFQFLSALKNSSNNERASSAPRSGSSHTISGSWRNHVSWRLASRRDSCLACETASASAISRRRYAAICLYPIVLRGGFSGEYPVSTNARTSSTRPAAIIASKRPSIAS